MIEAPSHSLTRARSLQREWRWECELSPDDPTPAPLAADDPLLKELVQDALRSGEIASACRAACDAPEGPSGEELRSDARARVRLGGAEACREIDEEFAALYRSLTPPPGGFLAAVDRATDPDRAQVADDRLRRWLDSAVEFRAARRDALNERSEVWASLDWNLLRDALRPQPAKRWRDDLRRIWVEPLDDPIAQLSVRTQVQRPGEAAGLKDAIAGLDRVWGDGSLSLETAAPGDSMELPLALEAAEGPALRIPDPCSPGDWLAGLEIAGRLWRLGFCARLGRESGAVWGDPGLEATAGLLFRRLALNPEFRREAGKDHDPAWILAVQRLEAVDPRRVWTYLDWELNGDWGRLPELGANPERDSGVSGAFQRSQGQPISGSDLERALRYDTDSAATLRGWTLALLLEDRWQSRYGRRWYLDRKAVAELKEFWDGESGQTVESMARALGAGTIEPTPLLDGCRPPGA